MVKRKKLKMLKHRDRERWRIEVDGRKSSGGDKEVDDIMAPLSTPSATNAQCTSQPYCLTENQ